jgi:hypothetical protein
MVTLATKLFIAVNSVKLSEMNEVKVKVPLNYVQVLHINAEKVCELALPRTSCLVRT